MSRMRVSAFVGTLVLAPGGAVAEDRLAGASGLSYLTASGPKQHPVLPFTYALIALMLAIVAAIAVLVVLGVIRRRAPQREPAAIPVVPPGPGLSWIYIGIALTVPALVGIAAWTYAVLAGISGPPRRPSLTIHVTGRQWWWELGYVADSVDRDFTTANEMHVPVGEPVRIELDTADVIHSFWVPALSGKMDTIPGQHNVTWIEADKAGVYRGQCTEYCGLQHAHMGLMVVAEPPDAFKSWWDHQLEAPAAASGAVPAEVLQGEAAFIESCGACHAIRGTPAGGRLGPDLSHLMLRRTIAGASLPNTIGYLSGWISSPQHFKPGNYMPTLALSGPELDRIRTFLETLK